MDCNVSRLPFISLKASVPPRKLSGINVNKSGATSRGMVNFLCDGSFALLLLCVT